jgi:hypothetical protein
MTEYRKRQLALPYFHGLFESAGLVEPGDTNDTGGSDGDRRDGDIDETGGSDGDRSDSSPHQEQQQNLPGHQQVEDAPLLLSAFHGKRTPFEDWLQTRVRMLEALVVSNRTDIMAMREQNATFIAQEQQLMHYNRVVADAHLSLVTRVVQQQQAIDRTHSLVRDLHKEVTEVISRPQVTDNREMLVGLEQKNLSVAVC